MSTIPALLHGYHQLQQQYDAWFAKALQQFPKAIRCARGCVQCCRGLFDISLLDAWVLQQGFARLPSSLRQSIQAQASSRLIDLQQRWPELQSPYFLNTLPDDSWTEMPEDDLTPCPLLSAEGLCLVYDHRPLTCRLHGLPNVDISGEVFSDSYCTLNFPGVDPLVLTELRGGFHAAFAQEMALMGGVTEELFGRPLQELDTFIPLALLVDYEEVDWSKVGRSLNLAPR